MYECVCEWMCWFCTLDILEFHPVIAFVLFMHCGRSIDCVHKNDLNFCVLVNFPFIFFGRSFLTEDYKCDYFTQPVRIMAYFFSVFTFQMP